MAQSGRVGDWARFFDAVRDDLLSAWLEDMATRPAVAAALDRIPLSLHERIIARALHTFGRAMDRGFSPAVHRRIERELVRQGYLQTFSLADIGTAYRRFLDLGTRRVDAFFHRRSPERRAAMCRELTDVTFANFAWVAAARVQLETDALQESETRFRTMVETAGEAIVLADATTAQIQYANAQARRLFKAKADELLGLGIDDLVPKRSRASLHRRLAEAVALKPGTRRSRRLRLLRLTGEPFEVALSAVRLDRAPEGPQFLVVLRDVSAEQARAAALRASSSQVRRVNEIGRALTATFDLDEILRRVLASARDEVPCGAASLLLLQGDRLVFREAVGPGAETVKKFAMDRNQGVAGWVLQHGESVVLDDAHADPRYQRGIEKAVGLTVKTMLCVPLQTAGRALGVLVLLNRRGGAFSASDVKLVESMAAFAAIALDKAVMFEERAALRQQLLQAEAATHAGRLASTIAQEMIDPLTILKNHQAIWRASPEAVTPATVDLVGEELDRLHGIIQLLVDYSNATADVRRPTPLDLLLADLQASLRPELEAEGVHLVVDQPREVPPVEAVPPQVTVALANLIRHAASVTPRGETVRVRLTRRGDSVEVAVADEGPSLSRQQIQTLVDPTAVQRGVLAKGLDLYIAAAIVRHHQGELRGRGHRKVGTTFSFSLPVCSAEEAAWLTP